MNCGVGFVIGLNMNVMWNFTWFGRLIKLPFVTWWINILSICIKKYNEYWIRWIMEWICVFWVKMRSCKGKLMLWIVLGASSFIIKRKEDRNISWSLLWVMKSIMIFYKENTNFSELYWLLLYPMTRMEWKTEITDPISDIWEVGRILTQNSESWATHVQVMSFWTHMCLFRPYTLINQFKAYQMSCQANSVYSIS